MTEQIATIHPILLPFSLTDQSQIFFFLFSSYSVKSISFTLCFNLHFFGFHYHACMYTHTHTHTHTPIGVHQCCPSLKGFFTMRNYSLQLLEIQYQLSYRVLNVIEWINICPIQGKHSVFDQNFIRITVYCVPYFQIRTVKLKNQIDLSAYMLMRIIQKLAWGSNFYIILNGKSETFLKVNNY